MAAFRARIVCCALAVAGLAVLAVWLGAPPGNSGPVRITKFYSTSRQIVRGQSATICYGVENARAVALQPPVELLEPSVDRCFSVKPDTTTTYVLYAEGGDGRIRAASFTVRVRPPLPPESLRARLGRGNASCSKS